MEDKIPLVFSTDENYIFPTFTVISSVLQCAHKSTRYDIFIQIMKNCTEKCKNMAKHLYTKYSNFDFHLIEMDQNLFKRAKVTNGHVKLPTYYRLLVAEHLPQYDKCIVLDSDILVRDDLEQLYHWEIGGDYIAGVKSWEDQQPTQDNYEHMINDGLPSMDSYIYSGVLLLNLKQIRMDNLVNEFVAHMDKGYRVDDQDIFNVCCYGKISFLPLRYNLLVRHYKETFPEGIQIYSKKELCDAWENPAIIHYPGRLIKPWKNNRVKLGTEWWIAAGIFKETEEYKITKKNMDTWIKNLGFQYIEEQIPEGSHVILFGFSDIGKRVFAKLSDMGKYKIIGFCDNDMKKQGSGCGQIRVYDIDEAISAQEVSDGYFIVTSQRGAEEIRKQLMDRGVNEKRILIYTNLNDQYYASIEK